MYQAGSTLLGVLSGSLLLALGLAVIIAKDWVWSLFGLLYGQLGIQAERTNLWAMFTTTIGLFLAAVGLTILISTWRRWRQDR